MGISAVVNLVTAPSRAAAAGALSSRKGALAPPWVAGVVTWGSKGHFCKQMPWVMSNRQGFCLSQWYMLELPATGVLAFMVFLADMKV